MQKPVNHLAPLNLLHILNDGFQSSLVLLLPFIAAAQGLTLIEVGALGTILNLAGIVLALPSGYIAAKIGGIRTLLLALFIYTMGFVGAGLFGEYFMLVAVFLLSGIGFGLFHPVAFALIAKWTPEERRGRTIGNFTAIGDVGRIGISAVVSFIVVAIGWQKTALLYAAIAAITGGLLFLFLHKRDAIAPKEHKPVHMSLWQIIKNRRLMLALSAGALDSFASNSLFIFLPFLLLTRGVDPALLGTFTAAFFIGNLFGKTLLGRLVDIFGNAKIFVISELLMAGLIFVLANSTPVWLIIASSIVLGVFTKGTVPVLQTMISDSVEHHGNFEKAFGLAGITNGIAITVAPILLGAVSDEFGIVPAFNVMAITALLAAIPAVTLFVTSRRKHEHTDIDNPPTQTIE